MNIAFYSACYDLHRRLAEKALKKCTPSEILQFLDEIKQEDRQEKMKFQCNSCEKYNPCTVIVKGECLPPTRCPFSPNADGIVEWKTIKLKAKDSK